jgi:hypothetical protein
VGGCVVLNGTGKHCAMSDDRTVVREVLVGWARCTVPCLVGAGLTTQDVTITLLIGSVATCWHVLWSYCEITVDPAFGVLLGDWRRARARGRLDYSW